MRAILSIYVFLVFAISTATAGDLVRLTEGNVSNIQLDQLYCNGYNSHYARVKFTHNGTDYNAKILFYDGDADYECNYDNSRSKYNDFVNRLSNIQANSVSVRTVGQETYCAKDILNIIVNDDTDEYSSYTTQFLPAPCY